MDTVSTLHSDGGPPAREGTEVRLTIVYKILGQHGDRIWVKSTTGKGNTFSITLPNQEQMQSQTYHP